MRKRKKKQQEDSMLDFVMISLLRYVKLDKYYEEHPTFQRFAKYGVLTTLTFWLAKAPLIWLFDLAFGDINLVFFSIPSYVTSAFVAGVIVTLLGFVYSEWGIWKK